MSHTSQTRIPLVIALALTAIFALVAMLAPKAEATAIDPPNTAFTASNANTEETWFVPNNAYGSTEFGAQLGLGCLDSSAQFSSGTDAYPFKQSINRNGTGTHSTDAGSVIADLDASFEECGVYNFVMGSAPALVQGFTVTVSTSGNWTVAGDNLDDDEGRAAIAVPSDGATVDIVHSILGQCVITVSPDRASSVMADYYNGNHRLEVDGQIEIETDGQALCGIGNITDNVAQFEGDYDVDNNLEILP